MPSIHIRVNHPHAQDSMTRTIFNTLEDTESTVICSCGGISMPIQPNNDDDELDDDNNDDNRRDGWASKTMQGYAGG